MISSEDYSEFVLRTKAWRWCSQHEREELVSQCVARFLDKRRFEKDLVGWLLKAANNIRMEMNREKQKSRTKGVELSLLHSPDRRWNGTSFMHIPAQLPIQFAHSVANADAYETIMLKLSPRDRDIVELCGVQGYSLSKASDLLGVPRSTIKSQWRRLRKRLAVEPSLIAMCKRRFISRA